MKSAILKMFMIGIPAVALVTHASQAADTNSVSAPEVSVTPVGQYVNVSGNTARFRQDWGIKDGWSGGAEDATYQQKLGKDWLVNFEGRAIVDNEDYKLRLSIVNPNVGYLRAGFTQFRQYYDNTGGSYRGFTPPAFRLNQNDLFLRDGDIFVEAGLTLPNLPSISFGYERQYRSNDKSLLEWGAVTQGTTTRNIFPSEKSIDESTDIFKLGLEHHVGTVQLANQFRYEHFNDSTKRTDTSLNLNTAASKTVTVHEEYQHDAFFNTFRMDQHLNDKVYWSMGYLYTTLDGSGNMALNTQPFNAPFDKDWTAQDISVDQDSHVINLNSMFGPFAGLILSVGLQAEHTTGDGKTDATLTELGAGGVVNSPAALIRSNTDKNSYEESLGARYTKIPFTTLYAEGRWTEQQIDLSETETLNGTPDFSRKTDTDVFRQDYTAGFNSAPIRRVTIASRYRHSIYNNDYENHVDTMPGYPAFITGQDFITDEIMAKLTLRPCRYVSLAFKYQLLSTEIKTETDSVPLLAPGGRLVSGNYDANIYSVSATVTPISRLYLTGLFSFQDTRTTTPSNGNSADINYVGNVYTIMGTAGYALDKKTDVNVEYTYSRSDNFTDNSADGLPLGLDFQRHALLVGLARRISDRVTARLRYGYYAYYQPHTGSVNDYTANLASASCTVRF